jgi:hypothetical protein
VSAVRPEEILDRKPFVGWEEARKSERVHHYDEAHSRVRTGLFVECVEGERI